MYSQGIARSRRTAFVLIIDRSASMSELLPGYPERTKAEAVAEIANMLLFEWVERTRRSDGVRDYYDVGVIGYSGHGVESLLGERWLVPITELAARMPKRKRGWVKHLHPQGGEVMLGMEFPEWIEPKAEGQTPLYEALCCAEEQLAAWCRQPQHRHSFPPVVFHITDGEASDADPRSIAEAFRRIQNLSTSDGHLLMMNCHLSSNEQQDSVLFPSRKELLGENRYAHLLYEGSSPMPDLFEEGIRSLVGHGIEGPFRGMSYNCSPHELMTLMNIGTVSAPLYG